MRQKKTRVNDSLEAMTLDKLDSQDYDIAR